MTIQYIIVNNKYIAIKLTESIREKEMHFLYYVINSKTKLKTKAYHDNNVLPYIEYLYHITNSFITGCFSNVYMWEDIGFTPCIDSNTFKSVRTNTLENFECNNNFFTDVFKAIRNKESTKEGAEI